MSSSIKVNMLFWEVDIMHIQCNRWLIDLWSCAKTQASAARHSWPWGTSLQVWLIFTTTPIQTISGQDDHPIAPHRLPLPNRWTGLLSSSVCYGASNYTRSPHQTLSQHAFYLLWAGRGLVSWNRGTHGMWLWLCKGCGCSWGSCLDSLAFHNLL